MEDINGGPGIVESPVIGCGGRAEQLRQRTQADARGLIAGEHPAGQPDRAQNGGLWPVDSTLPCRRLEEPDIEAGIVSDQYRTTGEFEKSRQYLCDRRCVDQHRRGDAGEAHDLRR
ncbi:Uncharacterised protein [Mycobacteroides abscessus subsp. abscessus]|nr:Uncharacterised protein [Mycobacteroides abscessus subsp. abscessus]